jgi:PLP dependent protein
VNGSERERQIRAGLAAVRSRVDAACRSAGRSPEDVTVVVVTKTYPLSDLVALSGLGVREVGENRVQEAEPKYDACAALGLGLRWHFIGQLQTNKARKVARFADVVHSVDRLRLVSALGAGARAAGRRVECLIQVALDGTEHRGGVSPDGVPAVAEAIAGEEGLVLGGVMAVAPLGADPRPSFTRLREVRDRLCAGHPQATLISAGMSGDLEAAVAEGATHLRVGSAILGVRPPLGYRPDGG